MTEIRFAHRDASYLDHPGQAWRYHAQAAPGRWFAACRDGDESSRTTIMLDSFLTEQADRIPEKAICKRPACYRKWHEAREATA
ncbi:hypothetical protein [Micromonospora sp. NPDC023644]|uniref:hypothetical protein n=1 Tax=Micromonospora sp. NPDC023644 TaxID=3154321 RepID=UPI0033EEB5A5